MTEYLNQGSNGNVESRARAQGWAPLEDWRGDPDRWKTAEEFVEFSERNAGAAQENLTRMEKKLLKVEEENQRLREGLDELKTYHSQTAKREYDRAYAKIKEDMNQAVEEGDTERFKKAEVKMDALIKDQEPDVIGHPKDTKEDDLTARNLKVQKEWEADNSWYSEEAEMHDYAWKVNNMLRNSGKGDLPQKEFLAELTKRVAKKFPDYFETENPRRRSAGAVEGDSHGMAKEAGRKKGKGYNDLPASAREACDRLTGPGGDGKDGAKIPDFTRAEYVRDFFGA